jgi:oligopeptide transport system substrate-binding protein
VKLRRRRSATVGSRIFNHSLRRSRLSLLSSLLLTLSLSHAGCFSGQNPTEYYGKIEVPRSQEFRWSDGGLPQTFDPAFAAAPPDTDAVRAIFEGLTDYDPQTLAPVPAVATRWESSSDARVWTFYLRDNAHWSNGDKVTAGDFVRSWKRTVKIGQLSPHTELLNNIVGSVATPAGRQKPSNVKSTNQEESAAEEKYGFGAEAISDDVLRVHLQQADVNFPALVAHPVFRPIKMAEGDVTRRLEAAGLISNGAFLLAKTDSDSVLLERAKTYWDGASVTLQRVEFVNAGAEDALAAYRAGEIDAVTSAPFEPLALKLLAPYKDFRRSTFGALTYYSFNVSRAPFDDVRVREALAISIDRERVSRDDLGGATEPAGKFLPDEMSGEKAVVSKTGLLEHDIPKAKNLLAEAGYPDGEGFPVVRLLINRNDQQRIVAQSIASMWRSALNIQTEIIMKSWEEYEAAVKAGGYDVVRRGIVMQTTDELTNLRMLFQQDSQPQAELQANAPAGASRSHEGNGHEDVVPREPREATSGPVDSESQALKELKGVPIYFASSYALVKPYVSGFDANVLDAPSLKKTRIDMNWTEQRTARLLFPR